MIFIPLILFIAIQATAGRAYDIKNHGEIVEPRRDSGQVIPKTYYKE